MKALLTIGAVLLVLYVCFAALNSYLYTQKQGDGQIYLQLGF